MPKRGSLVRFRRGSIRIGDFFRCRRPDNADFPRVFERGRLIERGLELIRDIGRRIGPLRLVEVDRRGVSAKRRHMPLHHRRETGA